MLLLKPEKKKKEIHLSLMIQRLALDLGTAKRLTNESANDFLTPGSFNHFKFRSHASHWGKINQLPSHRICMF